VKTNFVSDQVLGSFIKIERNGIECQSTAKEMSTQSLHLVDQEVEEEELSIMEIRSRNDSPFQRPTSVLQTFMTGISNQLEAMSQQQNAMSQQQNAMSQQQSHLMERLDCVEESLHGSGKGSPNSDFWTSRPAVTTHLSHNSASVINSYFSGKFFRRSAMS